MADDLKQTTSSTNAPLKQPTIPVSPDQSLASGIGKNLSPNNSIPSTPDFSLNSSKTMNDQIQKTTIGQDQ